MDDLTEKKFLFFNFSLPKNTHLIEAKKKKKNWKNSFKAQKNTEWKWNVECFGEKFNIFFFLHYNFIDSFIQVKRQKQKQVGAESTIILFISFFLGVQLIECESFFFAIHFISFIQHWPLSKKIDYEQIVDRHNVDWWWWWWMDGWTKDIVG